MTFQIKYNRSRFPERQKRDDGKWGCRGCGSEIPKGRTAWCSEECVKKFHPFYVIDAVKKIAAHYRSNPVAVPGWREAEHREAA